MRRNSISEGVKLAAPPISPRFVLLCLLWYAASALSNTSGGEVLNAFPFPVTLTIVQFGFVASCCVVVGALPFRIGLARGIRRPSKEILSITAPMSLFQLGGHVFSSIATVKIPVSLVHTTKALSPLFTVMAYRALFAVRYSMATYISLIPLTAGVMLACSTEFHTNVAGLACALTAALIFVSQNIFSKRYLSNEFPDSTQNTKAYDKLSLLFYSSCFAFSLTVPIWLLSEGGFLISFYLATGEFPVEKRKLSNPQLSVYLFLNGVGQFSQSFIAFTLLGMVSPVTYSVASLVKRIIVILTSIVWFGQAVTKSQGAGIFTTFIGLYMYDRSADTLRGERQRQRIQESHDLPILPTVQNGRILPDPLRHSPASHEFELRHTFESESQVGRSESPTQLTRQFELRSDSPAAMANVNGGTKVA